MKICIAGFGNIGSTLAANLSINGHDVSVYSSSDLGRNYEYELTEMETGATKKIPIGIVTNNLEDAVSGCELIFVTYPSFMLARLADTLTSVLVQPTKICIVPGAGGAEYLMKKLVEHGHNLFGLERVPYIARIVEKNKRTIFSKKTSIKVASISPYQSACLAKLLTVLLKMNVEPINNYLTISLTPSNSILHTSRLYSLFKDYSSSKYYDKIALFYEDWNDDSSYWLIELDKEVEKLVRHLPKEIDMTEFRSIREHYESPTIGEMTKKISSIPSFKGILTPMVKKEEGYIPDFSSRYFTEDFPYGLLILKSFAVIMDIETPIMDKVIYWAQKYLKKDYINRFGELREDFLYAGVPQAFGIETVKDIINYYSGTTIS